MTVNPLLEKYVCSCDSVVIQKLIYESEDIEYLISTNAFGILTIKKHELTSLKKLLDYLEEEGEL